MASKKDSTQLIMKFVLKNSKQLASLKNALHGFSHIFFISIENQLSDYGRMLCGVPQDLILGSLLSLIYVHGMTQAVNANLFLYAGDSCLMFQHKEVEEIEKILNNDFENIFDWFADNTFYKYSFRLR